MFLIEFVCLFMKIIFRFIIINIVISTLNIIFPPTIFLN